MNNNGVITFIQFYKNGRAVSKTIERKIGEYAAAKGAKGVKAAAAFEISWYNHPDKVRIFVPEHGKVYFYRITYKPHYENKINERLDIVSSYTPEYKYTYSRRVM